MKKARWRLKMEHSVIRPEKTSIQTGSIPSELSISLYGGTDFLSNKLVFLVPVVLPADCASCVQADEPVVHQLIQSLVVVRLSD